MTINYVGSAIAEATTLTLPAHVNGDMLVMVAFRNGSNSTQTIPTGWRKQFNAGTNTSNVVVAIKLAGSDSETSGTWTDSTMLACAAYRSSAYILAIGFIWGTAGTTGTLQFQSQTISDLGATSKWIMGVAMHKSNDTNIATPPNSVGQFTTNRASLNGAAANGMAIHDTNGYSSISSWATDQLTLTGTTDAWKTVGIEVCESTYEVTSGGGGFPLGRVVN